MIKRAVFIFLAFLLMQFNFTDEVIHETLGLVFLVLAVCHLCPRIRWLRRKDIVFRKREITAKVSALLIVSFLLTAVTGFCVSRNLVPFFRIKNFQSLLIDVHHFLGALSFLLICLHIGLHLKLKPRSLLILTLISVGVSVLFFTPQASDYWQDYIMGLENTDVSEVLLLISGLPIVLSIFIVIGSAINVSQRKRVHHA